MRILFLHLSDAHLQQNTYLGEIKPEAIVKALSQMGDFDECVLVFSGDIANAGSENEYKVAGKMFGKLLKGINDKYFGGRKRIHTLIVPGNHDNLVKNKERNHDDIKNYYLDKKTDQHYYEDLNELSNFFGLGNMTGSRNLICIRLKGLRSITSLYSR